MNLPVSLFDARVSTRNAVAWQHNVVVPTAPYRRDLLFNHETTAQLCLLRRVNHDQTLLARVPDLELVKSRHSCLDVVLCVHVGRQW
jgi:hypothetical protein